MKAFRAALALVSAWAIAAAPALAATPEFEVPVLQTPSGAGVPGEMVGLLNFDTVTGRVCVAGSVPTCPMVGGGSVGGSLSAQANAAAQTSTEGATSDPLSMDLHRQLRTLLGDTAGNPISFNDTRAVDQALALALNQAVTVPYDGGVAVVRGYVTGVTAAGATVTFEASNDVAASTPHWGGVKAYQGDIPLLNNSLTADGTFTLVLSGRTAWRARVSVAGTGSPMVVSYSMSTALPTVQDPQVCRTATTIPTLAVDGQAVQAMCGAEGKQIMLPYSIKEQMARGQTAAQTTAAANVAFTGLAAPGSGLKYYITDVGCQNTGASTGLVTLNDSVSTTVINPAGLGSNNHFSVPLAVAANTGLLATFGAASSSQTCNAQGYIGQ